MPASGKHKAFFMAVALVVATAVVLVPLLFLLPAEESIIIDEESWTMPGGGPSHLSYLPFAPKALLNERWNVRLEGGLAGPPAVAGNRVYAACDNGFLYSLDLETGQPVWRFDAESGIGSMPAVFDRGILVGTLAGKVFNVDARGALDWVAEVGGAVLSTPIPQEDRVYFGSSDGFLYCVSAEDGSVVWSFEAEGPLEVSPCIYEGQVFGVSFQGDLFALDQKDGRLIWTFRSEEVPAAFPSADDGKVFLATEFAVYCVDAQSGKVLWESPVPPNVISNLAVRGNQVIAVRAGGEESNTISFDSRTGDAIWSAKSGRTASQAVIFATNQDVYLCGPDYLKAFAAESGIPSMEREIPGILPETFALTERFVFAGADNRKVYCFEE